MKGALLPTAEQSLIVDAHQECDKTERELLLSAVERPKNSVNIKMFLPNGPYTRAEIEKTIKPKYQVSMTCPEVESDIKAYIENLIHQNLERRRLAVGQPRLLVEIREALD